MSIARVAQGLGVARNTANDAVLAAGRQVLINDPDRLNGVKVSGVDEHVWHHTRAHRPHAGARHYRASEVDMIPGRSKAALKAWPIQHPQAWRKAVEVVAMDVFTGFKTAATEEPAAVAVMDPFHVVRLAGDALNDCRCRVQQTTRGRGRKNDPLYRARRSMHIGADLLTDKQAARSRSCSPSMSTSRSRPPGASTSGRSPPTGTPTQARAAGRKLMVKLIESLSAGVPRPPVAIRGRCHREAVIEARCLLQRDPSLRRYR
ncbi:transposase [Streptomyces sp. PA03-6a]|nr:transposase [Streptomyces sp. PA03-6a]